MNFLPDALHVGFSKCASTFLQHYFQGHPDIFLVNQSHFFAPFELSDFETGKEAYCNRFMDAAPGQVKLESDEHIVLPLFHPVLLAAATTIESVVKVSSRIKAIQPSARIIIVVRNQVDLIVSRYSEYILGGGKGDFEYFVEEFLSSSSDGVNYYQNYYSQILDIFRRDFGIENVLILLQEELRNNERGFIETLCDFLKVPYAEPSQRTAVAMRVGLSDLGIKLVRPMNRMLVTRQEMSHQRAQVRIPYLLYKVIQRTLRTIDYYLPAGVKGDKNSILTDELARRIQSEFSADNRRLSVILGRNLEDFGY